ncbi:hypothetical protein, partial [Eubacterium aggregans]|uniref:hypothetical protein n=1 Tax=Eubacterium aggregans TaxID=81409 RepID=UPI003F3B7C26
MEKRMKKSKCFIAGTMIALSLLFTVSMPVKAAYPENPASADDATLVYNLVMDKWLTTPAVTMKYTFTPVKVNEYTATDTNMPKAYNQSLTYSSADAGSVS